MDQSERLLLAIAAVGSLVSIGYWRGIWLSRMPFRGREKGRFVLIGSLFSGLSLLYLVLRLWADAEVQSSAGYTLGLLGLGFAGATGTLTVCSWLGLSVGADVIGMNNKGAAYALAGAIVAVILAYAGGEHRQRVFSVGKRFFGAAFRARALRALVLL
jgi:hypothetical protein